MTKDIQSKRTTPKRTTRRDLNLLLGLSVLFSLGLVAAGAWYTGSPYYQPHYRYLVWNLFLAAIPFAISSFLRSRAEQLSAVILAVSAALWLLFFPNAPYILTDLFHLRDNQAVPGWYDLIVILSFAWNGLVLGFLSLQDIQAVIAKRWGSPLAWGFAFISLGLGSFGIYIGRYLRWNSWDIIANPLSLSYDIMQRILNPLVYPGAWGMTLVFTVFLSLCYLTLVRFSRAENLKSNI